MGKFKNHGTEKGLYNGGTESKTDNRIIGRFGLLFRKIGKAIRRAIRFLIFINSILHEITKECSKKNQYNSTFSEKTVIYSFFIGSLSPKFWQTVLPPEIFSVLLFD
jgi:hypothetical protein